MNQMFTLLNREILEHRSSLVWTQLGMGAAIFCLCLIGYVTASVNLQGSVFEQHSSNGSIEQHQESRDIQIQLGGPDGLNPDAIDRQTSDARAMPARTFLNQGFSYLEQSSFEKKQDILRKGRTAVSLFFQFVLSLVLFFYLIGSIYAERADRSVLFWKSMPVSDVMSVLSKLLTALLIAPGVAVISIFVTQLSLFILATVFAWSGGFSAWDILWAPSGIVTGFIGLVTAYLVQALWVLPIFAWLMLVSAWTNRSPFLVALIGPIIPIALEGILFQTHYIGGWIGRHLSWVVLPHVEPMGDNGMRQSVSITDSLSFLTTMELWSGVAVGILMLMATVYFRRQKNEI